MKDFNFDFGHECDTEMPDMPFKEAAYILAKLECDASISAEVKEALAVMRMQFNRRSLNLSHAITELEDLGQRVSQRVEEYLRDPWTGNPHDFISFDPFSFGPTPEAMVEAWERPADPKDKHEALTQSPEPVRKLSDEKVKQEEREIWESITDSMNLATSYATNEGIDPDHRRSHATFMVSVITAAAREAYRDGLISRLED